MLLFVHRHCVYWLVLSFNLFICFSLRCSVGQALRYSGTQLLTPDFRRLTPDDRFPTPDSRPPIPDNRLLTPDDRPLTPDSRRPTPTTDPDDRLLTPNDRPPTTDFPTTDSRRLTPDDRPPTTEDRLTAQHVQRRSRIPSHRVSPPPFVPYINIGLAAARVSLSFGYKKGAELSLNVIKVLVYPTHE